MILDEYDRSIRGIQDRIFEQGLDFVYFTKIESRFTQDHLQNLLKIEALFQKSVVNFYMYTKN
jgi:hypothetical protein